MTQQLHSGVKRNVLEELTPGVDLDVWFLCSLGVDAPPGFLGGVRFFDVDVEAVDRIAALVHWRLPKQHHRVTSHISNLEIVRGSCQENRDKFVKLAVLYLFVNI